MNERIFDAKAFLFDLDGTVVDNCAYHVIAWKEFSARHGNELSEHDILAWMGATNRDYFSRILNREISDAECRQFEDEKESIYRELYRPHMRLSSGLREILTRAHELKIPCAIASGAPRKNIDFVFDALNLHDDFVAIVDASCYAQSKPAPDCYLAAAERVGVAPSTCIVFEDAVGGILSGRNANMFVVAITQTNSRDVLARANPDVIIDSFTELL